MSLFINQDQNFAHQVHLLEHKLRSKEERILELETEKAILHLRLAECLGRLRRGHEGEAKAKTLLHHQREAQSITQLTLGKLLAEVQNLKQVLSEIFAVYANGVAELEGQSKQILEKLDGARATLNSCHGDDLQSLQSHMAALERDLVEEKERCRAEKQRRREIHNTLVELRGNIRVHCRVRPVLPLDQVQSCSSQSRVISSEEVIHVSEDTVLVNCIQNGNPAINKVFEFERVHGPEDSQNVVFEEVKPLLTSLLDGYNVCIMAYGQTGSGKTHTMMGSQGPPGSPQPGTPQGVSSPGDQQGIIPQAAVELFRLISGKPSESHVVEVSVVEVYNNEVFDLLSLDGEGGAPGQRRDVITTASGPSEVCEERPRGHAAGLGSGKAEGPLPHPGARPLLPLPPGGHAHRLLQQPPRPGLGPPSEERQARAAALPEDRLLEPALSPGQWRPPPRLCRPLCCHRLPFILLLLPRPLPMPLPPAEQSPGPLSDPPPAGGPGRQRVCRHVGGDGRGAVGDLLYKPQPVRSVGRPGCAGGAETSRPVPQQQAHTPAAGRYRWRC
ncbi:kinesin-like protein KIF25 isoform X3 [Gadus morhua]|uniref:kinesin-like protein KIF25 isoform X3 n=1 Tax=Gadus morhua TaxID=8049 RepID=UPI0011B3A9FF|nr:kinesin-like protein KIF25 isoform X3 [Gadus morhua]